MAPSFSTFGCQRSRSRYGTLRRGRIRHDIVIAASRAVAQTLRMRRIWIAVFPDVQALDVTGPLEVFSIANRLGGTRTRATTSRWWRPGTARC
jgi:hypothetical protein